MASSSVSHAPATITSNGDGGAPDFTKMCRLCLVKEQVNVSVFDEPRKVLEKIKACLPVKVSKEDKLPKRICEGCVNKLDTLYQFRNTSSKSEQQLLDWLEAEEKEDSKPLKVVAAAGSSAQLPTATASASTSADPIITTEPEIIVPKEEPLNDVWEDKPEPEEDDDDDSQDYSESADADFNYQEENDEDPDDPEDEDIEEPAPKRPRRSAASKAATKTAAVTKTEVESGDEEDEPAFVSVDEVQAGPSGLGSSDAPSSSKKVIDSPMTRSRRARLLSADGRSLPKTRARRVAGHETTKRSLPEDALFFHFRDRFRLKPCVVLLGDLRTIDESKYTLVKKNKALEILLEVTPSNIVSGQRLKYKCDLCEKRFKDYGGLSDHRRSHGGVYFEKDDNDDANDEDYSAEKVSSDDDVDDKSQLTCKVCNRNFKYYSTLLGHMKRHQVACFTCSKRFPNNQALNEHIITAHKVFQCVHCPQMFYSDKNLKKHNFDKHGISGFKCDICRLNFENHGKLLAHNKSIHDFGCEICGLKFSTFGLLTAHTISHRQGRELGVKENSCDLCGKIYADEEGLQEHVNTHFSIVKVVKNDDSEVPETVAAKPVPNKPVVQKAAKTKVSYTKKFKCTLCRQLFDNQMTLSEHLKEHLHAKKVAEANKPIVLNSIKPIDLKSSLKDLSGKDAAKAPVPPLVRPVLQSDIHSAPTPPLIMTPQGPSRFIVVDNKKYMIVGQENGVLKVVNAQDSQMQPIVQAFSNFLQPAINQTIVLPNNQNASQQISITNQTYGIPDMNQGLTNIIYTPVSSNMNVPSVSSPSGGNITVTSNVGGNIQVSGGIPLHSFHQQSFVPPTPPDAVPTVTVPDSYVATPSVQTPPVSQDPVVAQPIAMDPNFKPKIFLKPLSELMAKPASVQSMPVLETPPLVPIPASTPAPPTAVAETVTKPPATKKKKSSDDSDSSTEDQTKNRTVYKCKMCNIICKRAGKLHQHQSRYKCKVCSYGCCGLKSLDKHYSEQHNFKNRCVSCDQQFETPLELQNHKKKVHFCVNCRRCYFDLKKHRDNHKCTNCDFIACNAQALNQHYKMVHKIITRCAPCNTIYYSNEEFFKHKNEIHYCDRCGTYKMDLNIHQTFCKGPQGSWRGGDFVDEVMEESDKTVTAKTVTPQLFEEALVSTPPPETVKAKTAVIPAPESTAASEVIDLDSD